MIKVIKEKNPNRAWDKKDKNFKEILNIHSDTGSVVLAPFNNRKLKTITRAKDDCIIEAPTDVIDSKGTQIFENDKVVHKHYETIFVVKKGEKGNFLLTSNDITVLLDHLDTKSLYVVGHQTKD